MPSVSRSTSVAGDDHVPPLMAPVGGSAVHSTALSMIPPDLEEDPEPDAADVQPDAVDVHEPREPQLVS